jgi:hypothetical protein
MSGGSLNYLYCSDDIGTDDLWKIEKSIERLERLIDEGKIKTHHKAYLAYKHLKALQDNLKESFKMFDNIKDVLHEIEWEMSGDTCEDDLIDSLQEYKIYER